MHGTNDYSEKLEVPTYQGSTILYRKDKWSSDLRHVWSERTRPGSIDKGLRMYLWQRWKYWKYPKPSIRYISTIISEIMTIYTTRTEASKMREGISFWPDMNKHWRDCKKLATPRKPTKSSVQFEERKSRWVDVPGISRSSNTVAIIIIAATNEAIRPIAYVA